MYIYQLQHVHVKVRHALLGYDCTCIYDCTCMCNAQRSQTTIHEDQLCTCIYMYVHIYQLQHVHVKMRHALLGNDCTCIYDCTCMCNAQRSQTTVHGHQRHNSQLNVCRTGLQHAYIGYISKYIKPHSSIMSTYVSVHVRIYLVGLLM